MHVSSSISFASTHTPMHKHKLPLKFLFVRLSSNWWQRKTATEKYDVQAGKKAN